jgi:hypothetical protein
MVVLMSMWKFYGGLDKAHEMVEVLNTVCCGEVTAGARKDAWQCWTKVKGVLEPKKIT